MPSRFQGPSFALIGLFSGVLSGVLMKGISGTPASEAIALRSGFGFVILGIAIAWRARRRSGGQLDRAGATRAVLDAVAGLTYALAIFQLPLALLATIHATLPLMSTVMSVLFLRESLRPGTWVALSLGLGGIAIILRPGLEISSLGLTLALVSTVAFALRDLVTRRMTAGSDPLKSVLLSTALIGTSALTLALTSGGPLSAPPALEIGLLLMATLTFLAANTLIIRALRLTTIGTIAPLRYTNILWSLAFDAMLWGVWPSASGWLGIACIVAAGVVLLRGKSSRGLPHR